MLELSNSDGSRFRCLITNSGNITIVLNGKNYTVAKSHCSYEKIKKAINDRDTKLLYRLLNTETVIQKKFNKTTANGKVEVKNGGVYYNGELLAHSALVSRILDFANNNLPFEPLSRFLAKLYENPSKRAVDELFGFLSHQNIPICDDGDFLCYKSVKSNYYDKYSGKTLNTPGSIIEIPRNQVDDDCNRTCSYGYHVGSLEYSGPGGWYNNSGDKIVVVKVNPRDAVAVPIDHSMQKLRVCRYEVVRDYDDKLDAPLYNENAKPKLTYDDFYNDDEEWEDEDDDCYGCGYDDEDDTDLECCGENEGCSSPNCIGWDTRNNYTKQKRDSNGRFVKK